MTAFFDYAHRHGFALFRCIRGTKQPAGKWKDEGSTRDRAIWEAWVAEGFNLAINAPASNLIIADIDSSKVGRDVAWQAYCAQCKSWGLDEPPAPMTQSANGGWHAPLKRPEGVDPADLSGTKILVRTSDVRPLADGEKDSEVVAIKNRGYVVAPGSIFTTADGDKPYLMMADAPEPPECPAALIEALRIPVVEATVAGRAGESCMTDVAAVIAALDAHGEFDSEPDWFRALGAIKLALGDTEAGISVAEQITFAEVSEAEFRGKWDRLASVDTGEKSLYRVGSLIHRAEELTGRKFHVGKSANAMFAGVVATLPVSGPDGLPMLSGQTVVADLGRPIVEGFNSGQHGQPAVSNGAPTLPESVRGHPLFDLLNLAIARMTAMADRARGALTATAIVDVLGVLAAVHQDTYRTVIARIRSFGCALPEGRLYTAVKRFETTVSRELRTSAGWRTNHKGEPDPQNADNVGVLLRFVGASLRFNTWRQRPEIKPADGDWVPFTDFELNRLRAVASQEEHRFRPTKEFMRDMLSDIARGNSYDPVCDFIDSQTWDGKPRLATWLSITCGVTADTYHQAIGKNVIGGIVKRARRPGCKHDEVLILIGPQGCGKSELTKALALKSDWHTDSVAFDGSPQNVIPQLFGKLVVELSELDGVHRRDVRFIKRFLSTQSDSFTAKYEAFANDHARRCIFIGTCNLENPLVDDTGNRRFYPVRVVTKEVDLDWLQANVGQLIAEAAQLEAAGENFRIPKEVWADAAERQEAARSRQDFEVLLESWFGEDQGPAFITAADLTQIVGSAAGRVSSQAVGSVMRRLRFERVTPYTGKKTEKSWCRGGMAGARRYVGRHELNGFLNVALTPDPYFGRSGPTTTNANPLTR